MKRPTPKGIERIIQNTNKIKKKKKGIHEHIIDDLLRRILTLYEPDIGGRNIEYDVNKQHGEIDLFYIHNFVNTNRKVGVAIEVKSHDSIRNYRKAVQQLNKDEQFLKQQYGCDIVKKIYATKELIKYVK